jgi:hypothetical protein
MRSRTQGIRPGNGRSELLIFLRRPRHSHELSLSLQPIRPETRYRGAVDVRHAADLYTEGSTLGQIGAELGVHWSAVSQQLRRHGVIMRRRGPRAQLASPQRILELRDQDLSWNEVQNRSTDPTGAAYKYRDIPALYQGATLAPLFHSGGKRAVASVSWFV